MGRSLWKTDAELLLVDKMHYKANLHEAERQLEKQGALKDNPSAINFLGKELGMCSVIISELKDFINGRTDEQIMDMHVTSKFDVDNVLAI